MKKKSFILTLIMLSLVFSFIFLGGCTKKTMVKEEPMAKEKAAVVKEAGPGEMKKGDEALKGTIMKEKPFKEAALKKATETGTEKETSDVVRGPSAFGDIHFDFDNYDLKPEAREILKKDAAWLARHENFNIIIEGNCDERGTSEYNLALGQRRAEEALKYLVVLGINEKRIKTISYGKEKPLDPGHNEEAWAKNRRDHFSVTSGGKIGL